jgi:hypothetical protein
MLWKQDWYRPFFYTWQNFQQFYQIKQEDYIKYVIYHTENNLCAKILRLMYASFTLSDLVQKSRAYYLFIYFCLYCNTGKVLCSWIDFISHFKKNMCFQYRYPKAKKWGTSNKNPFVCVFLSCFNGSVAFFMLGMYGRYVLERWTININVT